MIDTIFFLFLYYSNAMLKRRFLVSFLSFLYILFIWKADLYTNFSQYEAPKACCEDEVEEESSCCGKELADGKCQSSSCCHISLTQVPTSLSFSENKIEIGSKSNFSHEFCSNSSYFISTCFNYNLHFDYISIALSKVVSLFQHYLAFISYWRC